MSTPAETIRTDYETTLGDYWASENYEELGETFKIRPDELPAWHDEFAGQGRAWEIMRRLYRLAPMIGHLESDDLRSWTRDELAEKWGLAREIIDSEIKGAVTRWRSRKTESSAANTIISDKEIGELTRFSEGEGLDEQTIERLLNSFNFTQVRDRALRAEVAHRIVSLKSYLADSHTRTMAREVIRMEVSMHGAEQRLVHFQNDLDEAMKNAAKQGEPEFKRKEYATAIEEATAKIDDADKTLRKLATDHSKLLKDLGADELDLTARKRIFVDTVAYLIQRCGEYESNPDNAKLDGMFTAAELDWQLDPLGERDPQYRPDIAVRVAEAMQPENLWNPDYVPTPIQRKVSGELRRMVRTIRTLRNIPDQDDDTQPDNSFDEDEEFIGDDDDDAAASRSSATVTEPSAEPLPEAKPWVPASSAGGAPPMGFF